MRVKKVYLLLALIAAWTIVSKIFNGQQNLQLATADNTPITSAVGDAAASIRETELKARRSFTFSIPFVDSSMDLWSWYEHLLQFQQKVQLSQSLGGWDLLHSLV